MFVSVLLVTSHTTQCDFKLKLYTCMITLLSALIKYNSINRPKYSFV